MVYRNKGGKYESRLKSREAEVYLSCAMVQEYDRDDAVRNGGWVFVLCVVLVVPRFIPPEAQTGTRLQYALDEGKHPV